MNPDTITAVATFLAAQTGLLIWQLSSLNTQSKIVRLIIDRLETKADTAALHLAALPCNLCAFKDAKN